MPGTSNARVARAAWFVAIAAFASACATPAEMRKLNNRITDLERGRSGGSDTGRARLADLGAQVEALQISVDELSGRLEVMERRVEVAMEEARAARSELHQGGAAAPGPGGAPGAAPEVQVSEEVQRDRAAYAKWREGDARACIDQFGQFLQTYPASEYADDATYWLGDCYFKQGNFSAAVLRFDDVARQYPEGNKAADALYRQGEALLRMGHGTAAGNAFEKVLRDYPDSARASEAQRQLDLLQAG